MERGLPWFGTFCQEIPTANRTQGGNDDPRFPFGPPPVGERAIRGDKRVIL